jgi:hypothetical protein
MESRIPARGAAAVAALKQYSFRSDKLQYFYERPLANFWRAAFLFDPDS